jgi:heme A synthase
MASGIIIEYAFYLFLFVLIAGIIWYFVNSFRRLPRKKAVKELIIFLFFVMFIVLCLTFYSWHIKGL